MRRVYLAGYLLVAIRHRDPKHLRFMGFKRHCSSACFTSDCQPPWLAVSLAAHAIALNTAALTYMVPLGISSAAVSVGRALRR